MEPVRLIPLPIPLSAPTAASDMPLRPVASVAPPAAVGVPERQVLDPAVSVELNPDAASTAKGDDEPEPDRRGFERDAETQALVFRITDALNGDVIVQIPNEVVLKARAYGRQPEAPTGERVAKTA